MEVQIATTIVTADEQLAQKELFAIAWLQNPTDPFKAALSVFPGEVGVAISIANTWVNDPVVLAKKAEVVDELGDENFLPNKSDLARAVWDLAASDRAATEDKIKAYKLYGEIRGFIQGPTTKVNHNVTADFGDIVARMDAAFRKSRADRGLLDMKEVLPIASKAVGNG